MRKAISSILVDDERIHFFRPGQTLSRQSKPPTFQHLGEKVHSLYLRESIARGTAIAGVSDVDTFAVIFGEREDIDRSWIVAFQQCMAVQYPLQTGIEIGFVPYRAVCDAHGARGTRLLIKTQCDCLWGEDLAPPLPRYKPGRALVGHAIEIKEDIQQVIERLPTMEDAETVQAWCQWIMKRVVRTGFELVMEHERAYTRDLYPCYVAFARHFPAQAQQMHHALARAIEPSDNKEELAQFLDGFGAWLVTVVTEMFPAAQTGSA